MLFFVVVLVFVFYASFFDNLLQTSHFSQLLFCGNFAAESNQANFAFGGIRD